MTKQEIKFYKICEVLKNKFNWTRIYVDGKEKREAFLHKNGKTYSIMFGIHGGLTLSYGVDFAKSVDMLDELNTTEEYLLKQCERINKKCLDLIK